MLGGRMALPATSCRIVRANAPLMFLSRPLKSDVKLYLDLIKIFTWTSGWKALYDAVPNSVLQNPFLHRGRHLTEPCTTASGTGEVIVKVEGCCTRWHGVVTRAACLC